jgi:hypothetical protein
VKTGSIRLLKVDPHLSDRLVQAALPPNNPSYEGVSYSVVEKDLTDHLQSGSQGINHGKKTLVSAFLGSTSSFM